MTICGTLNFNSSTYCVRSPWAKPETDPWRETADRHSLSLSASWSWPLSSSSWGAFSVQLKIFVCGQKIQQLQISSKSVWLAQAIQPKLPCQYYLKWYTNFFHAGHTVDHWPTRVPLKTYRQSHMREVVVTETGK